MKKHEEVRREVLKWFGPKLRKRMQELKILQSMLEEMTGIGCSTICDYCLGRYEPSLSKIKVLCEALDVDLEFFFEKDHWPDDKTKNKAPVAAPSPAGA